MLAEILTIAIGILAFFGILLLVGLAFIFGPSFFNWAECLVRGHDWQDVGCAWGPPEQGPRQGCSRCGKGKS